MSYPTTTARDSTPQEDFWSAHPCGAEGAFRHRMEFRYRREAWIKPLLQEIGARHQRVLEVGCGQGIDGFGICAAMTRGSYLGVDYSSESVRTAQAMSGEARSLLSFGVEPEFRVGSALDLPLPDNQFDCVYSLGVLHHTPSPQRCVDEAFRVLEPGGTAYIALYRKYSLKVTAAKLLRATQKAVDRATGLDRSIYRILERRGSSSSSGTMLLECFGVPFMEWYTRRGMLRLFRRYEAVEVTPIGANLLHDTAAHRPNNPWGFMWLARARKPASSH